jgi:hypothetical protein
MLYTRTRKDEDRLALATLFVLGSMFLFSFLAMKDYVFFIWGVGAPLAFIVVVVLKVSCSIDGRYLLYPAAAVFSLFGLFWIFFGIDRTISKTCLGEVVSKELTYRHITLSPYGGSARMPYSVIGVRCHFPEYLTIYLTMRRDTVKNVGANDAVKVGYRAESLLGQSEYSLIVESINNMRFRAKSREFSYIAPLVIALFPSAFLIFAR